jgi:Mg2+ and Co2+ transporter CorA
MLDLHMSERPTTIDEFLVTPPIKIKDLFEHPTCTDFERRFRSVLTGEFDNTGELRSLGALIAGATRARVVGLERWGMESDEVHWGIIKNPDDDQSLFRLIGSRNSIVQVKSFLFASYPIKKGVFQVVREVFSRVQSFKEAAA